MALLPPLIPAIGRGRRKIDYEKMYQVWQESGGLTIKEFFGLYDLDFTSSKTREVAREWRDRVGGGSEIIELKIPKATARPDQEVDKHDIWKTIKLWRVKQGEADYLTADALRQHIKIKLNQALVKNPDGTLSTKLGNRDVNSLSNTLINIQKIQRLALGMSTENVGVSDNTTTTEADTLLAAAAAEDDVPTFVVEVNKNGKFVRPKPRQLKQASK